MTDSNETNKRLCDGSGHEHSGNALLPDDDKLFELAEFFKVLGDSTRVRILCALQAGEMCVCDISDALSMTQSAISHQLRLLKTHRLVKLRREGKNIFYSLDDDHIATIIAMGLKHIAEK